MHIPREIRKKLESSLPAHVLEFLTEKFAEHESNTNKVKELEYQNDWLHQQLHQLMANSLTGNRSLGYVGHTAHYSPWEYEEYPGHRYRYDMRHSVHGNRHMRYEGNRNSEYSENGQRDGQSNRQETNNEHMSIHEPHIVPLTPEP